MNLDLEAILRPVRAHLGFLLAGGAAVLALFLLTFPLYATGYQLTQIAALSMILGIVALSLVFLAGYGGLVSLAQLTLAGMAGYTIGIMTVRHDPPWQIHLFGWTILNVTHTYPWWAAVLVALVVSMVGAFLFAVISVRTHGIYFLMITLALGMTVYEFAEENYELLNGHGGIGGERAPTIGGLSFDPINHPKPFYYLTLLVAALLYLGLRYLVRTPFGLALQGIRDNPRRMRALGYWVEAHRIAAFTVAGFVAGMGGILYVWYYATIAPGFIDLTHIINILIIAVIGGMIYFEGAFLGALVFTWVTNFASSYTDRYNTVIGLTFLLIVLFSPNGLIGLLQALLHLPANIARLRVRAAQLRVAQLAAPRQVGAVTAQRERPRETGPPATSEEVDRSIKA